MKWMVDIRFCNIPEKLYEEFIDAIRDKAKEYNVMAQPCVGEEDQDSFEEFGDN